MKHIMAIARFCYAVSAAATVLSCSQGGGSAPSPGRSDAVSAQVHAAVNSYRAQRGRATLERHAGLDKLASQHSAYLLAHRGEFSLHGKNVSHYGFQERALAARRLYGMDAVSENVAAAKVSPEHPGAGLLELWKRSPDHHKNLLESWKLTGIGAVTAADGTVFSTQLFATRAIGHQPLRDRIINNYQ